MMVAGERHCEATVVYGYVEAASTYILAQVQTMRKSEHQEMFLHTIEEDATQHPRLCNRGRIKGFEISSVYNKSPDSINIFYVYS